MGDVEEPIEEPNELVREIRTNLRNHSASYRDWRKKARESYNFVASEQWTDEEKQMLQESSRTPIVFNRVARTINAVTGLELQNRQEVSYKPVSNAASGVNDVMNSAAKWVRSNCDAEDEESEAFADTLICGIGATETLMDYSTNLDGMVVIERIDPFECAADSRAKKRNFDDARWVARWKTYSKEEFEDLYPDVEIEGKALISWDDVDESVDHADDEYKHEDVTDKKDQKDLSYTVVKYQYYEDESCYRVPVGQDIKTLTVDEYKAVEPVLKLQGIQGTEQKKRVYKQVIICGDTILEQSDAPIDGFSIRFITGLRDRNRNNWFGLVELMKDPQRWANKWLAQIQYIINSNAKGGLLYEANTFTNQKKAKADWAKPNSWIEVVKGALVEGRVRDRTPPAYPEGIDRLLQQALTAINDVPGVNVEMLGIANRNQPGMIEDSRKDAGVTILASFFDALRRYRKEQGRVLQKFIVNYISDGRLIRIDGANAQYVPLVRDQLSQQYDILVDDAPTSPNMKEKTFKALSSMLGVALQAGIPVPPEILEYSPLPSALVEKWMNLIQQKEAAGSDPEKQLLQQQLMELQDQLKIAANEVTNKHEENMLKAQAEKTKYETEAKSLEIQAFEAETERMKVESEMVKNQAEAMIKAHELENPPVAQNDNNPPMPMQHSPTMGETVPQSKSVLMAMLQEMEAKDAEEASKLEEDRAYKAALLQGIHGIQLLMQQQIEATNRQAEATNRQAAAIEQPKRAVFQDDGTIDVVGFDMGTMQ